VVNKKVYTQANIDFVKLEDKVNNIERIVSKTDDRLERDFVKKEELALTVKDVELLKRIVYGVVSLILTAVVGAVVSLVVMK
jgi:uncharacterized membrane protein